MTNDGPYIEEFYRAVRALNATLPKAKQLRVLGGDPPIDWANVVSKEDIRKWTVRRDSFAADVIHREVVERGRRALVVYGHLHFPRKEVLANYDMSDWQVQTMTSLLERAGIKPFVIWAEGGKEIVALQPEIGSWPALSLTLVRGTVVGAADFTVFNGGDRRRPAPIRPTCRCASPGSPLAGSLQARRLLSNAPAVCSNQNLISARMNI